MVEGAPHWHEGFWGRQGGAAKEIMGESLLVMRGHYTRFLAKNQGFSGCVPHTSGAMHRGSLLDLRGVASIMPRA